MALQINFHHYSQFSHIPPVRIHNNQYKINKCHGLLIYWNTECLLSLNSFVIILPNLNDGLYYFSLFKLPKELKEFYLCIFLAKV